MELENLKAIRRWTLPSNYGGAEWPDYYSSGFGQSRDSSALERSNFRCAWRAIRAASSGAEGSNGGVQIVREGHWAVGWVEWIAIPDTDDGALREADEIRCAFEGYPVVCDEDFSEEEQKEANEVWANCYSVAERIEYIRKRRHTFEFRNFADLLGCVRGKYFAGYASELIG